MGKPDPNTGAITGLVKAADADKDLLTYSAPTTSAKGGTVFMFGLTGMFTYSPTAAARHAAAANGAPGSATTDSFTVTVDDGQGAAVSKVVTVKVLPANKVPVNATPTVNAPDAAGVVRGNLNVSDADADALTISTTVKPAKGTVVISSDGRFAYTPTAAAMHAASVPNAKSSVKLDTFSVKVTDGHGGSVTQTVTVTIAPANAAPVVTAGPTVTKTNTSTGAVTGTITATDANKDTLKYTGTALNGTVSVTSKGVFTYTPSAAARHLASSNVATTAQKTDTVSVSVDDGHGGTVTKSVQVVITPKNTAPTVNVTVGKPDASTGVVTGTVKATDAEKDSLTYSSTGSAKGGAVVINSTTGTFTYTPTVAARNAAAVNNAPSAAKTDTFTVTVSDAHGGLVDKVVTVTVSPKAAPTDRPPTNGHATVNAPDPTTGAVTGILSAIDVDGDPLTFTAPSATAKGAVTINGSTFVYTPTATARQQAASGTATAADKQDGFTVTASDGRGGTTTFAVNVSVAPAVMALTTVHNLGSTKLAGPDPTPAISPDGKRAAILTTNGDGDAVVTMLNTANGAQIGVAAILAGSEGLTISFNATSTRAVVTTSDYATDDELVSVFNTSTGAQVGTTIDLGHSNFIITAGDSTAGALGSPMVFSSDGARALVIANSSSFDDSTFTETYSAEVHLINLVTGTSIYGTTIQGMAAGSFSGDGSKAAIVTFPYASLVQAGATGDFSALTTTVTFLDTATGGSAGPAVSVAGLGWGATLNHDGSRAVISAVTGTVGQAGDYSGLTSTVTVLNTATGAHVGNPATFTGREAVQSPLITPDGSRAVVSFVTLNGLTSGGSAAVYNYQSSVAVINLATGNQVGVTSTVAGIAESLGTDGTVLGARLVANGTRALLVALNPTLNGSTVTANSTVALIDTATGMQVGQTASLDVMALALVTADGSHVWVFKADFASALDTTPQLSPVMVIDALTGAQTSVANSVSGRLVGLNSTGSRGVVVAANGANTTIKTFDTATGAQVGSSISVTGTIDNVDSPGRAIVNGDYAVLVTSDGDSTTYVSFVNVNTGALIGTTTEVDGLQQPDEVNGGWSVTHMIFDGTHAVVLTTDADGFDTDVTLLSLT